MVNIVKLLGSPVQLNFTGGVTPLGAYNAGTGYVTGDSVSYNGSSYVAIQATTGNLPTNTTFWQVLASIGNTGATGSTGPAGAGLEAGGTTGQVLAKASNADYDTEWLTVGALTDGDKGDITVSASGATWTVDNQAITLAKMADMATDSFLGRDTAGAGVPEVLSVATAKTLLNLTGTNSGDQTIANSSDATSHTVTLSATGGSVQFIEGSNITLTTGGTGSAGTVTIASTGGGGGYTNLTQFVDQTAWRLFYSNTSGDVTELALGADGTFLKSNGASAAPTFATPAGSGDVSKVGTPVNNQIGVWTGDGTLEGDVAFTFDTTTDTLDIGASGNLSFGAVVILDDAAGVMTLSNVDALDATTEATIEAAIDTLANLTSIQGLTVTLADAGADAVFGWDDSAGAYTNLSAADARTALALGTLATQSGTFSGTSSGTNTGDQTSIVGITGSLAEFNAALTGADFATGGGTATGSNTGDNAVNTLYSGLVTNATHTGDATGSGALTVVALNGTNLAGLATGVLKNTTTTGVPFISKVALTEPATAATLTIANNQTLTVNGSATITNGTHSGTNTGDQTITNSSDATSHTVTLSASGGTIQFIEGTNISLTTGGTGAAGTLTIAASGGSGDVTKVGTPVDNQVGVWTGDGTIEGSTNLTFDGTTLTAGNYIGPNLTASRALQTSASKQLESSAVTNTELGYVSGVTSAIQTQLGTKAPLASPTFTGTVTLPVGLTGVLRADTGVVSTDSDVTDLVSAASDVLAGKVELATIAETSTGTDATRAVTPDGLAGSVFGEKSVCISSFPAGTNTATGNGTTCFVIPASLNGMNLVSAVAAVDTAGTTGTTNIMIRRRRQVTNADMLTVALTIDSGEADSTTAATGMTIDAANDDVATGDKIYIDVDAVSTTPAQGLSTVLTFRLP